jgi:carbon storage regulator
VGPGGALLVLTRRTNQSIMIGDDVEISILSVAGEKVRIGIDAPSEVPVFRKEVWLRIAAERNGDGQGVTAPSKSEA